MNNFKEIQKITQWWIWALLLGVAGIWVWGIVQQVIMGHTFGNNPMSNTGLLISSIIPFGLLVLFYILTLKTEVNSAGISVKYFPFVNTHVSWNQIRKAEIITYSFVGYGIRFSSNYGTIYNAKGNKGLLLEKTDGDKILIGTQQPEQLSDVVSQCLLDKAR